MNHVQIPQPTPDEVDRYLNLWDELDNYVQQESSLHKLFTKTYPHNTDMDDILIKVCSLNDFYSTNIYSPFTVARHILRMGIDPYIQSGDLPIVNELARVTVSGGKMISFYSFASKYFSHHRPDVYPIYDYYVERVLLHFRRLDKFYDFRNADLKDYLKFSDAVLAFGNFYGLEEYGIKDIDRYLWQVGKQYFPRKYQ